METNQTKLFFACYGNFPHAVVTILVLFLIFGVININTGNAKDKSEDIKMIEDFIQSEGCIGVITFDASNIKQFWIDRSVLSKNGAIQVMLEQQKDSIFKSIPLKIQLTNALENQKCKISIISEKNDIAFSVLNNKNKVISKPSESQKFIQHFISASEFNLEDTQDFSFNIVLESKNDSLAIEKIVLTFFENKQNRFAGSPGFEPLLKKIETEGIAVPESEIKYVLSKKYNKLFIMIPKQSVDAYRYFYHVFPLDKKDIDPERKEQGLDYNNMDFKATDDYRIIPKPLFAKSDCEIIQVELPAYQYSVVHIGQHVSGKKIWTLVLKADQK